MACTASEAILLVVVLSMLAVSSAVSGWDQMLFPSPPPPQISSDMIAAVSSAGSGWNQYLFPSPPPPQISPKNKKIMVGGSENWRFGFDYNNWALKNGPFYINDTLGEFQIKYVILKNTPFPTGTIAKCG